MSTTVSPLLLNTPQSNIGLGTWTFTVPTTGAQYYAQVSVTVPANAPTGSGGGSGQGLGSGAGGGDAIGFAEGGSGTGDGGVGQGFGAVPNNYQQPPNYGSNQTSGSVVTSGLSILVKDNGSTVYTAPTLGVSQSALQFKYDFTSTAGHSITVVLSSSTASDQGLEAVQSNIMIGGGL